MDIRWSVWIWLGIFLVVTGCGDEGDDDSADDDAGWTMAELDVVGSRLQYHPGGYVDILDTGGHAIVSHGVGALTLDDTGEAGIVLGTDADRDRTAVLSYGVTELGHAQILEVTVIGEAQEPDLIWTIAAYHDEGFFTFRLRADNGSGDTLMMAKAAPLQVDWERGGGLFLGEAPAEHRILENGSYAALDFIAFVLPGDVEHDEGYANLLPGNFQGHSVSTGNHAVTDLAWPGDDAPGSGAWVAGALTYEYSSPVINISHNPLIAPTSEDGRLGFHFFSAESAWLPHPKPLDDGESIESELYYVQPAAGDARFGLERYAAAIATQIGTQPWHRREEGRRVPNGWNSWSGSGSTGGYGTSLGEAEVIANLDVMATELRDWGIDWFQFDDGYEPYYGDWYDWVEDKFPNGPQWLSQQFRDRGFKPGLWMAPFTADAESQLVADHPDWFIDPVPLGVPIVGESHILDLSHPDVHQYLHDLFTTFRWEWGFEWLKLDFGYWALFGEYFYEEGSTREEAWRSSMEVIRDALGEDAFFLIIGQMGPNFGIADGGRLTLDTMPVWDTDPNQTMVMEQQGLKPSQRTASRRWYVSDRVWVNHPDLFFFRSNTLDESWPRVTATEARTFATYIALTGGIVKLGDRLVDLTGDHINVIRTMIPIYPTPATPLDVFEREFPEVFWQTIDDAQDGFGQTYHVAGLFHWGANVDMSVNPYEDIPDTDDDRTLTVDLVERGLTGEYLAYEFWTGEFLGTVTGELTVDVPSHDCRVVAIREPLGRPQFLGWNRQVSMGGTVLGDVRWDEEKATLTVPMTAAVPTEKAPFTYEVTVHVPTGYVYSGLDADGVDLVALEDTLDGELVRVTFEPAATGDLTLTLTF